MKFIKLTQNRVAFVDDDDYERVSRFNNGQWRLQTGTHGVEYAVTGKYPQVVFMQYFVMVDTGGLQIDHKDGNGLNNQKNNLRLCTNTQNQWNKGPNKNNSWGYKGVSQHIHGRFTAQIMANRKLHRLGLFDTPEEAARAYNEAAKRLHGEFAYQNPV